jgi:prevent-host-death family protein
MVKRVAATDAKNNFGGLLEDVGALGRVEIVRHGRVVAVVLSPRELHALEASPVASSTPRSWQRTHLIPAALARKARKRRPAADFHDD